MADGDRRLERLLQCCRHPCRGLYHRPYSRCHGSGRRCHAGGRHQKAAAGKPGPGLRRGRFHPQGPCRRGGRRGPCRGMGGESETGRFTRCPSSDRGSGLRTAHQHDRLATQCRRVEVNHSADGFGPKPTAGDSAGKQRLEGDHRTT